MTSATLPGSKLAVKLVVVALPFSAALIVPSLLLSMSIFRPSALPPLIRLLAASVAVLPAISVALAVMLPEAKALPGVRLQLPLASAMAVPMTLPEASVTSTVSPGSAVPLTGFVLPVTPLLTMETLVVVSTVNGVPLILVLAPFWVTVMTGVCAPDGRGSESGTLTL